MKIRFTKRKIFWLTIVLLVAVGWICYSRAEDRSAIRTSLIWSRMNPIPASASELGIKISGSFFTRDFELDFTLGAADLDDWLAQSPGIKDAKLSTDAGWTVYWIKPGGGAQFAELRVDRATGKVRVHTYWS